jgi:putative transposase
VPTHGPGHLRTFDYIGLYRYFLTFCTDSRRHLFTTARVVDAVLLQIERGATQEQFAIVAYCFMPDHFHLLTEASSEASDCRRFIKLAKQLSAFHYSKMFGGRLWQRYGFEHVLRNDEDTVGVARYILENPIRAGLVRCVHEYPFVGSRRHSLDAIMTAVAQAPSTFTST